MNTQNMIREQISVFVDNETAEGHVDVTLADLRQEQGRATWSLYHRIGDALRSDDLNGHLSADFNARMFARLDAEPTIMAPPGKITAAIKEVSFKRFAMPGMAAAAVAVAAFLTVPQMMTQTVATGPSGAGPVVVAAAEPKTIAVASQSGEVLRDPQIDEYLLAHQRFSPSVYSTAQYARSATFAVDSDNN